MQLNIDKMECCKRIVVKIGSSLLVDLDSGSLKTDWLEGLVEDITALQQQGHEMVIVSSGSIALGRKGLGLDKRPTKLEDAQAAAAIGQIKLAHAYEGAFQPHNIQIAQLLLTLDDLEDRKRFLNARNTVEALISRGIVPVINENDTVATQEIRFGDNDRLAARVGAMASADLVILLSDIDGLFSCNPKDNPDANLIPSVTEITKEIEAMAGPVAFSKDGFGTGGMITKIQAAKVATQAGISMAIVNGLPMHPIARFTTTGQGTIFHASDDSLTVRKAWINSLANPHGFLHLDAGAKKALNDGSSLLAAGVTNVDGNFDRGDLVAFLDEDGQCIGQGLSAFSAAEIAQIKGQNMNDVSAILGYSVRSSLVHRDDLVLF